MQTVETKLNIHTPWYIYRTKEISYYMTNHKAFETETHLFECGELCNIDISNNGWVKFYFKTFLSEKEIKEYCSIFLYFISLCNGYNCKFESKAYIDGVEKINFFTYPEEDKTNFPLLKDSKIYEISLEDIKLEFGNIINNLFSSNKMFILSLLSNYYSMVFYKDFIGNGIYKFRNIVVNIESIITIINAEKYSVIENENEDFFNKLKIETTISKTKLKRHLSSRRVSLKDKLKDVLTHMQKYGLDFKLNYEKECQKIADTRNFISHLFNVEKDYLTDDELCDYTDVFEEIFRMLFLEYCGINASLICKKFLQSPPICFKLNRFFDINKV